ncbi:hypothetical protein O181_046734 [Austropuccinia psidii MF-1]|uniref:Uncharacterized protein n=1 Tax=Austropuccinia psidii MF-1 TaxID=1389203 RepID=A0A9Q3DPH2_9BASI|nr:hypothetical protein [Austropuccinia psidii MF-1]
MDLIHVQDAKMQKAKPARGKGYTCGASCITNVVIHNREAKLHLYSGAFCTCVGKDYLDRIYTNWKERLTPSEGRESSGASQDMHPLSIFEAAMIFPHPAESIRLKKELVEILFQYTEAFAFDNEPLGAIIGHEVDIMLNVERNFPPLLRRPAYPASPRARGALQSHVDELVKLGVLRKVGNNEEVEVTTPVIITWNNDNSRMVDDFRAFNTYTIPDRYPIPRIRETFTQLSKA